MAVMFELALLVSLVVGLPLLIVKRVCRGIEREIASWVPARTDRHRYQHVTVIAQPRRAQQLAGDWWPHERWSPPHG